MLNRGYFLRSWFSNNKPGSEYHLSDDVRRVATLDVSMGTILCGRSGKMSNYAPPKLPCLEVPPFIYFSLIDRKSHPRASLMSQLTQVYPRRVYAGGYKVQAKGRYPSDPGLLK
jgi:hypothetical protein